MQHPTEPLAARDATTGWRCRRQRQAPAIVEPLVIPCVVVVRDELADGATRRCCMKNHCGWGGVARTSRDPPQEPHYRDAVEGPSHVQDAVPRGELAGRCLRH